MGVFAGTEPTWASQTNTGRTHIATKGIVQSGLVLNLDAGVSSSYPGSGTTWTDLSGNGNTGTLVNGVGYNSGNGGALVFDGVNDYVTGNTPSELNLSQPCTVNIWVYFNNFSPVNPRIIEVQDSSHSIQVLRVGTNSRLATKNSNFQGGLDSTSWFVPSTSIWYNISVVWNPSTTSTILYLNSVLQSSVGSTTVGIGNQANKYVFGVRSDFEGSTWLNGNISQVSIYNRALTAQEIQQNYNALRSRFSI